MTKLDDHDQKLEDNIKPIFERMMRSINAADCCTPCAQASILQSLYSTIVIQQGLTTVEATVFLADMHAQATAALQNDQYQLLDTGKNKLN